MTSYEPTLREAFRKMDARRAREIPDAYYKTVEGLQALTEALEAADAEAGEQDNHLWLDEYVLACDAHEAMKQSALGRIL